MRIRAFLLAGAIVVLVQPGISSAQNEGAPAAPPDAAAVTVTPASTSQPTPPAADPSPAETPAEATMAAATSPPNAAAPEPAEVDDPMICRKEVETGTIGRRYKICMTKSQWEKHRQATRKFLRSVNQSRATQGGGEAGIGPSSMSPGG